MDPLPSFKSSVFTPNNSTERIVKDHKMVALFQT